jgi:hypothetical protein
MIDRYVGAVVDTNFYHVKNSVIFVYVVKCLTVNMFVIVAVNTCELCFSYVYYFAYSNTDFVYHVSLADIK